MFWGKIEFTKHYMQMRRSVDHKKSLRVFLDFILVN